MRIILIHFLLFISISLFAQKDTIPTDKGDIILTPIFHATMVLEWNGKTIFIDPYGGAERFAGFQAPDLVLITHKHGDHLNKETLSGLSLGKLNSSPSICRRESGEIAFGRITALKNGAETETNGIKIIAVPMYNLPEAADSFHPKGWGNGYVLEIGGKRLYISGDTEDIEEMRNLENIDVAFVCMNLPYTMDIEQATSAVLAFNPKVVYPFHYRGVTGYSAMWNNSK